MRTSHFHDDSYDFWILYERLKSEMKFFGRLTIAYDLDDTVRSQNSEICSETIETIKRVKRVYPDTFFIVYTANPHMDYNYKFLEESELPYDAINDHPKDDFFKWCNEEQAMATPKPKLFFNILLDDKSFGLKWACRALNILCNEKEMEDLV